MYSGVFDESCSAEEVSSQCESEEEDYGAVRLDPGLPYQDEPLAIEDEGGPQYHFEEDPDGIPRETLVARFEKTVAVGVWCKCTKCKDELLSGPREHCCCREVASAEGKMVFDGTIDTTPCVTLHEDYNVMVNTANLLQVAPLLKDKTGRSYKQRAGQTRHQFLRAIAYRWVIQWIFGYLGWDKSCPLPACIYHQIRTKFPSAHSTGYKSVEERA